MPMYDEDWDERMRELKAQAVSLYTKAEMLRAQLENVLKEYESVRVQHNSLRSYMLAKRRMIGAEADEAEPQPIVGIFREGIPD